MHRLIMMAFCLRTTISFDLSLCPIGSDCKAKAILLIESA